jgi:hypothetical protein
MAGIAVYAQKAMLDWALDATAVTRPTTWAVGVSIGVPTSVSGSEIATASGFTRQALTMNAAASPAGSISNANGMTWGPASSSVTVSGLQIWDNTISGSGNMWWYGTFSSARAMNPGDVLVVSPGNLIIVLS